MLCCSKKPVLNASFIAFWNTKTNQTEIWYGDSINMLKNPAPSPTQTN